MTDKDLPKLRSYVMADILCELIGVDHKPLVRPLSSPLSLSLSFLSLLSLFYLSPLSLLSLFSLSLSSLSPLSLSLSLSLFALGTPLSVSESC